MARQGNHRHPVRALCLAGALLAPLLGAPARAEILPLADMLRGITMTPQQCAAKPLTMWVRASVGGYCMRYYLSTVGGEGRWATVFLQGDQFGKANLKAGRFDAVPAKTKDTDTDRLQRMADMFSKKTGGPAIYLARIGVDGSSGYHIVRHSVLELQVTNAALNGIKQRHQYEGFHLAGQSGGGTLVGGLLGLRQDIRCAAPGSGRLASLSDRKPRPLTDPGRTWFDPSDSVALIARHRARILVVTDPEDKKVPLKNQAVFVERLRRVGGQAEQYFVQAIDDNRHGTVAYAATAVGGCIRGESQQVIAQNLAEQVRTRVAAAAKAKAEKQVAEATRLPVPGPQRPLAPRPVQVAQLPAQSMPLATPQPPYIPQPAYRQSVQPAPRAIQPPPLRQLSPSRPQVQTAQPTYRPPLPPPSYRQPMGPAYQPPVPTTQPVYPRQTQYQGGYQQYPQSPRAAYRPQVTTAQPIYPQTQYRGGYQQYPNLRPLYQAPVQAPPPPPPPSLPPQQTYQQQPLQPAPSQPGYTSPPVASPPAQASRPMMYRRTVRPAEEPQAPPPVIPSQRPHHGAPGPA